MIGNCSNFCPYLYASPRTGASASGPAAAMAAEEVAAAIKQHKALIFSKSYCPYCDKAKAAFKRAGVVPHVIELDGRADCGAMQAALGKLTGETSVPRVFVGGEFVGGGDDTDAKERSGKLAQRCKAAGLL